MLSARLLGEIAAYFRIPSVIGELVAGIIIGPSMLGLVEINNTIHLLAQIGIILLLLEVGIETDIGHLSSAGMKALVVAVGGVVLPIPNVIQKLVLELRESPAVPKPIFESRSV